MNIETEYIKSLLTKYYDGYSTLDEERILREYFTESVVDPALEADRAVFAAMAEPIRAPESLRTAVEKAIDRHTDRVVKRRLRPRYGRIAAAVALLTLAISASLHFFGGKATQPEMTPEEAREHTVMALTLLTETVRKGCAAMETGMEKTSTTIRTAENSLKKL